MTGVSTLGQSLDQIERLKKVQLQVSDLATQLTTGKKTQKFSGLTTDVLVSKRSRADFKALDGYINNIKNAETRINLTLNALKEFRAQSKNFDNFLVNFSQESAHQKGNIIYQQDDPGTLTIDESESNTPIGYSSAEADIDFESLKSFAANVYDFLVDLVNRQDGDRYLFGGADSTTKPLEDNGILDAALSTALVNWKDELGASNITTDELIADLKERTASAANPDAITDTIVGYSANLSAGNVGKVFVRVDENSEINYTSLANNQGFRDILVAVSYIKNENLGPIADVYNEPYVFADLPVQNGAPGATTDEMKDNFFNVFNELQAMVSNALQEIDTEIRTLETARVRINESKTAHQNQKALLLNIISGVEDADTTEIAVTLNTLQVTLDASYRVTARLQELSLVNFI
jgi:flagellar hook-associated protein 3 FlgL